MKTLPLYYRNAIAALYAAKLAPDFEYHTDNLNVYCRGAPDNRMDLLGRVYLEAFEKIPGGITFLNNWITDTPTGFREFFAELSQQKKKFLSPRPYRLGQACDGTITSSVLAAFKVACDALGFDADTLYKKAYPEPDDPPPVWADCRQDADWQGGVVWPGQWDATAINGLVESLTEINYHSLVTVFSEAIKPA